MAPKKKTKLILIPTIRSDFLASLPKKSSGPSNLNSDHLSRAYGLAPPRLNATEDENLNRTCPNKWIETSKEIKPLPPPKEEPKVVFIADSEEEVVEEEDDDDDDDDDDEVVIVDPAKTLAKGKGKAKDSCSLEHCVGNPKCLNWLGQNKWEDSVIEAMKRNSGMGSDPANPREPNTPAGLKNLGATCYANSFLQVWYQDETFRAGVYACLPPANGNTKDSPLYQLQVLFAFLQNSKQAVYNPEPLVNSLKIDTGEQQDSQEFSKLFLSLLDHEFKKQGNRAIKDAEVAGEGAAINVATLVEEQFEGKVTYGIKCSKCHTKSERHSTFLELAVILKKDCKLEEQLRESLRSERMTDDNQYFCDTCQKKRDATSTTTLTHLPPVLHISLLRFVFSYKDFTRSKSTHAMSYPLKLDMGQFLPPVDGKAAEEWYDLRGVLMHKGTSAHHGHYVAQVRDGSSDKWYLFDDEYVTPIEDLNAPDRYDDEEEVVAKKPKVNKAGFIRQANGEILPKSKDAYMLIYAKRGAVTEAGRSKPEPPTAPPLVSLDVETLDSVHDAEAGEYLIKEIAVGKTFEALREKKRSVYRVWDLMEDDEETYLVDKSELKRWLESDLPVIQPKSKKTTSPIIDLTEAATVSEVEVPTNGASTVQKNLTMEEDQILNADADDDISISPTIVVEDDMDVEMAPVDKKGKKLVETSNTTKIEEAESKATTPVTSTVELLENVDMLCPHNMASPAKARDMKRIGQLGVIALRELGVEIVPQLSTRSNLCRECVWGIASEDLYRNTHLEQVESFLEANKEGEGAVWISKSWYNDWVKEIPTMHQEDTSDDPAPDSLFYKGHVICEHNKLQANNKKRRLITPEAATFLQTIFPTWDIESATASEPCARCNRNYEQDVAEIAADKQRLIAEKKILKSFDSQLRLCGNRVVLHGDIMAYGIPKAFVREWVQWTKGKGSRPGNIDNSHLICRHNRLMVDLAQEIESPQEIEVITEKEWKFLVKEYDASPIIMLYSLNHQAFSQPEVCQKCLDKKLQDFSKTTIKIRSLTADDFEKDGTRKAAPAEESRPTSPVATKGKGQQTYGKHNFSTLGSRTSRRLAEKPEMMKAKASFAIEIEKLDTVKDLKVKIDERMKITTIYQRLFLDGRELENDETVETLGLCSGSTLELFEVKDLIDIDDLDDTVPDVLKTKSGKRGEGFGGTGLAGWDSSEDRMDFEAEAPKSNSNGSSSNSTSASKKRRASSPVAREEREGSFTMEISCPACTFLQVIAEKCSVCGSELLV